jgi:hypothetical protein
MTAERHPDLRASDVARVAPMPAGELGSVFGDIRVRAQRLADRLLGRPPRG